MSELLLVPSPGLPAEIGRELARELPARLDGGNWEVAVADDEVTAEDMGGLVAAAREARERAGAELAICLTDVPLRTGNKPLTAALDAEQGVGVVSVPATGATGLRRRVRRATESVFAGLTEQETGDAVDLGDDHELSHGHVLPAGLGHLRLLAGMVRANRPWRALHSLSSAVVAALATGAYAVINATVWQLAGALGPGRLLANMLIALVAVVGWIIVAHHLWEGRGSGRPAKERRLYNAATLITLSIAVIWGYVILFVVLLAVCGLLIESGVLSSSAKVPADLGTYLSLAWLGASIASVAGGLGSGLEDLDDVREAAYGHHQCRRGED